MRHTQDVHILLEKTITELEDHFITFEVDEAADVIYKFYKVIPDAIVMGAELKNNLDNNAGMVSIAAQSVLTEDERKRTPITAIQTFYGRIPVLVNQTMKSIDGKADMILRAYNEFTGKHIIYHIRNIPIN